MQLPHSNLQTLRAARQEVGAGHAAGARAGDAVGGGAAQEADRRDVRPGRVVCEVGRERATQVGRHERGGVCCVPAHAHEAAL